jgi:tRNA pseudouridine55 synthase
MDGFLVVDKPAGVTSHDIVARVRKLCGLKKVGHTGTLDPFATGVLPVALGEGTKAIPFLDESVKEYRAVMKLGETTDTGDCTGALLSHGDWQQLSALAVAGVVPAFTGAIHQVPPMYSALKRNGVPLYRLARRGETVVREPRPVIIHALTLVRVELPLVEFVVSCSRGTYVRTLAEDMGKRLGCGAHLLELRRTVSGPFTLDHAVSLENLAILAAEGALATMLLSPSAVLAHLREIPVTDAGAAKLGHGIVPGPEELLAPPIPVLEPGEKVRFSRGGRLLAVAEQAGAGEVAVGKTLRLLRVFN